jgi:hypothetical protein
LESEHQHIILCFAADQMRWCFCHPRAVSVHTARIPGTGNTFSRVPI